MPRVALMLLLGLAACGGSDTPTVRAPIAISGWRMATGQVPTQVEFNAVIASCQDRGAALGPCLSDLGLRRVR